jgi:ribonuclease HII
VSRARSAPLPGTPTGVLAAGVDEAGRGPLAGPVAAAAVILDPGRPVPGLGDSKTIDAARREVLAGHIRERALAFAVCFVEAPEIDRLNILQATLLAMARSVAALSPAPGLALVDGNRCPEVGCTAHAVVGGDARIDCIGAASILAKVERDARMHELHARYPEYGFDRHKGYPTREHKAVLARLGPTPEHRCSFAPVRAALGLGAGEGRTAEPDT